MTKTLRYAATIGNILFILWVVYNGIDEWGAPVTLVQMASYLGLIALLALNTMVLWRRR